MGSVKPMSAKIIRVYLIGAIIILFFYSTIFYLAVVYTENQSSERRLALIAPHHFKLFDHSHESKIEIDPILQIFDSYDILPVKIQSIISPKWQGIGQFHFADDSEYNVLAQQVLIKNRLQIVYAVEDIDSVESDDTDFAIFQLVIAILGMLVFIVAAFFIVKIANRIGNPLANLAEQLNQNKEDDYEPLLVKGEQSRELVLLLGSINSYRNSIREAIDKEKAFARYVSHELRTPMTVIRCSISLLHRVANKSVIKQANRIDSAVKEMEKLIHTFLLLATNSDEQTSCVEVSNEFLQAIVKDFEATISANQVEFIPYLTENFSLPSQPILLTSVIKNLLRNAINCSVGGRVELHLSSHALMIIDTGVGLASKPRGYEGFGIGLNIVRDICTKYQWQFSIANNKDAGCTAMVLF